MATTGTRNAEFPHPSHTVVDQCGREITIDVHDGDPAPLEDLYERFDDESRAQGIPPRSAPRRTTWIEDLLEGHNVVAWHEGAAVGHAVLVPYDDAGGANTAGPADGGDDAAELAVFVRPDYQSAGIGTALVRCLLGLGGSVGLERVTLVVEPSNTIAVRLYRSTGFEVTERHRGDYEMARAL
jgi:ribosomal protein S18 acetylase RimI-like enzyme